MTTVEIAMMLAFLLALGLSGWKLYAFIPNESLDDDDTNATSVKELKAIMYDVISDGELDEQRIITKMKEHPAFDHAHFWRFNHNRLKQLLNAHFLDFPHHENIEHIFKHLSDDDNSK